MHHYAGFSQIGSQFLNGSIVTQEKVDLLKRKVNAMKITKARADGNNLHTGKEWRP